jgi:hypothetical protein
MALQFGGSECERVEEKPGGALYLALPVEAQGCQTGDISRSYARLPFKLAHYAAGHQSILPLRTILTREHQVLSLPYFAIWLAPAAAHRSDAVMDQAAVEPLRKTPLRGGSAAGSFAVQGGRRACGASAQIFLLYREAPLECVAEPRADG